MGHVGPPEPPNVRLRPKLTSCMETLWALTCFSTIPSYKTVTVKLILLRIFSATFFKCSSTFDTTSIILWMPKWTRIHTLGTSSPTHSPSTLFTFSNSTVLVKISGLFPWGYAFKYFWYFPVIPLGLLHDAHYSQNVPKYLNVGSLGLTLAHEILHSLDQMGRGFDANGTRRVSKPPFIFHSFGARKHDRWSSIYDIFSWIETLLKLLQNLFSILFFSRKMHHFFPRKQDLSCGNNRCFFSFCLFFREVAKNCLANQFLFGFVLQAQF